MKLFLMVGIPGSGKSTYSKRLDGIIVSRDEVRKGFMDIKSIRKRENAVKNEFYRNIETLLEKGENVIADATHLSPNSRKGVIDVAMKYNAEIIAIKMVTPLYMCMERNSKRDKSTKVPVSVLLSMSNSMKDIDLNLENIDKIIYNLGNQ